MSILTHFRTCKCFSSNNKCLTQTLQMLLLRLRRTMWSCNMRTYFSSWAENSRSFWHEPKTLMTGFCNKNCFSLSSSSSFKTKKPSAFNRNSSIPSSPCRWKTCSLSSKPPKPTENSSSKPKLRPRIGRAWPKASLVSKAGWGRRRAPSSAWETKLIRLAQSSERLRLAPAKGTRKSSACRECWLRASAISRTSEKARMASGLSFKEPSRQESLWRSRPKRCAKEPLRSRCKWGRERASSKTWPESTEPARELLTLCSTATLK